MNPRLRYQIRIKRSAEKEMDSLPERTVNRLVEAILALEDDPRPRGCKKLRGAEKPIETSEIHN